MSTASGDAMADEKEAGTARTEQTTQRRSPPGSATQSTTSIPTLRKQLSTGRLPGQSLPPNPSPRGSRTTSPLRKENNLRNAAPTPPTGTVIQRALSASNVSQLATDSTPRLQRSQRNTNATDIASPRTASPPGSTRSSMIPETKKDAGSVPSINIQAMPAERTIVQSPRALNAEGKGELQTPKNISRGPSGKSVLATVDENSSDAEVKSAVVAADLRPLTKLTDEDKAADSDRPAKATESGSESGGNKSDGLSNRRASQSQPLKRSKHSYTSLAKARPAEGTRNMTVETETVQSIAHSGLTADRNSSNRTDGSGTVRMKSSNETIRPKKERRHPSKKTRSITQGIASTKADLFEARVASAVDEANSSDSDETFVYESNPPEPRPRRHHSRTPSVTSAHSTSENRGMRSFGEAMDERRIAGKRSMKFSANPFQSDDSPSDQNGTVRSHQARHYGRWGRGGSHASMFDPDSPFTQASKLRSSQHSIRHSRPNSPRSVHGARTNGGPPVFGKKKDSPFDFDIEAADDERTPLMGTVRTPRSSRHHIRIGSHPDDEESIDEYYGVRRRSRCGTLGSFLLGLLIFALVVFSTVGFLVASNQPLTAVHIRRIDNVLATDQEILLDLRVGAINPNALSISIVDIDLSVNAKSKDNSHAPDAADVNTPKHSKDDSEDTTPLLALGHVMHFDQPLDFAGTPIKRSVQYSTGGLHLAQPGNKTGSDGSARWEKMLHHPFELILRGVLKYKLPISAREESVEVMTSIVVHPEDGVDEAGRMRVEPVDHNDHWQWIDWDREKDMLDEIAGVEVGAFE